MISQRVRGLQNMLLVCQALLVVLALWVCGAITFTLFVSISAIHLLHYFYYGVVLIIGLTLESMTRDRTRISLFQPNFADHQRLTLRQTGFALGLLLLYLAVMKDAFISRTFLFVYAPALYLLLRLSNQTLPPILARYIFRGNREEKVLLIGPAASAARIEPWLRQKENLGFRVVGILNEPEPGAERNSPMRLGRPGDVEWVLRERGVTQVVLLELPESSQEHQQLINLLDRQGVRLLILSNLEEKLQHKVIHVEDGGLNFITTREEPLENPFNRILKRMVDVAIAVPVVMFLLPFCCVLVWIVHRLQSPGPLLYRQTRAGIQNRQFEIIKFRTMHLNEDAGRQASRGDARIFNGGAWLRRLSIDELPQFRNVLRGEMSVVGPRPHLIEHNDEFARAMRNYNIRAFVKPGITGLAQVRGFRGEARTTADITHRLESDIYYIENWRLGLDVAIIIRTAAQMIIPPKSAV